MEYEGKGVALVGVMSGFARWRKHDLNECDREGALNPTYEDSNECWE